MLCSSCLGLRCAAPLDVRKSLSKDHCHCRGEAAEEPDLKAFLLKNRNAAGLSLQWLLFGSSGHKRRPEPGGPLRHYSTCTGELAYQMKCMASTFHLCDTPMLGDTVHDCAYKYAASSAVLLRFASLRCGGCLLYTSPSPRD